jgi:hypothetical protein
MTTKRQQRTHDTSPVTVKVVEPHLVYHDGQQRSGTITGVPADVAEYWQKHGWVTLVEDKPAKPKPEPTGDK